MSSYDIYFAADTAENCIKFLDEKSNNWFRGVFQSRQLKNMLTSWEFYYGFFYDENHEITFGGESGELVNAAVNHYRNLAQHILNMVTGVAVEFQCQAVNNDRKSMIQAELGNDILSYYLKERRLERKYNKAAEFALIMGSGYVLQEWDAMAGNVVGYTDVDPEKVDRITEDGIPVDKDGKEVKGTPIYSGDVVARVVGPLDMFFDQSRNDPDEQDWYLVRTFVSKFELIAKYPELKDKILEVSKKENTIRRITTTHLDPSVDIPVYQFYHRSTPAKPEGRYLYYLNKDCVFQDTALPYPSLPVQRISFSDVLGSSIGYTSMFDLIPLQQICNSVYSTIITNHHTYGVQNILNPSGNNVRFMDVAGGNNWIEYTPVEGAPNGGKPEALQLTKISSDSYELLNISEKLMETISGVNSVARGNPEASLKSGTALAMIQSQAIQFMSGFQKSYVHLLEDAGTFLLNLLKTFGDQKRNIAIAGKMNVAKMREFNNDDIIHIDRAAVRVGNSLLQTTAGRFQLAENFIQMGLIQTPEKALELINTGNLQDLTSNTTDELDTIRKENEDLLKGDIPVIALATDAHAMHIRNHRSVLSDPVLRHDKALVERVLAHMMEHINLLRDTDPGLLSVLGEQPMSPMGGTPNAPQQPSMEGSENIAEVVGQGQMNEVPGMPNPAKPPKGFEEAPQTPQELLNQTTGA